MPSILVFPQPTLGLSIISINWGDTPSVLYAKVTRTVNGVSTVVRPHTSADSSGDYIALSGGLAVLYDTEAPFNVPITYTTEGLGSVLTATAPDVVTLTNAYPWLKSPLHPWANQQLVYRPVSYQELACIAGNSIIFAAMEEETRPNRSSAFFPHNSEFPISASRIRASIQSSLRLVTRTFDARDAVITLNAPGDPLLFQVPAEYGIPDRYMTIGDYTVSRFSTDHKKQWRANTLPHVEIESPPGLADGVLGVRWADLCGQGTFAQAETAGLTWTAILLGQGASPPIADFCDYDELAASYTDYDDMEASNVDYNALLDC